MNRKEERVMRNTGVREVTVKLSCEDVHRLMDNRSPELVHKKIAHQYLDYLVSQDVQNRCPQH